MDMTIQSRILSKTVELLCYKLELGDFFSLFCVNWYYSFSF